MCIHVIVRASQTIVHWLNSPQKRIPLKVKDAANREKIQLRSLSISQWHWRLTRKRLSVFPLAAQYLLHRSLSLSISISLSLNLSFYLTPALIWYPLTLGLYFIFLGPFEYTHKHTTHTHTYEIVAQHSTTDATSLWGISKQENDSSALRMILSWRSCLNINVLFIKQWNILLALASVSGCRRK